MRLFFSAIIALFLCSGLVSCKKEIFNKEKTETELPNFGNIDVDDVFERNDGKMDTDSVLPFIENYYSRVWEKGDLWGGLLIAKGDHIIFEKYRGFAMQPGVKPITENVPMHVASVSKTLTAMAMMKLVEAGKVKLDDPVTKFFPEFPYPYVTVFTLLSQRSGLPKYEYFIEIIHPAPAELSKKFITNKDVLNLLIRYKPDLARETNTGFMYCNTNFALLALIIEEITKTPFPDAMEQMVFRPLKMKNTFVFTEKDTATAARSFYNRGPRVYPLDRLDLIYGDKNVYTTPRDLLNFSKALYAKNFLKDDLMKMVFEPYSNEKPGINNYGLGFRMKIFDNGEKLTYHNGWWHGSNTVFAHLLKSNVTIVAIGNKYSQRVYSALALSGLFEDFPYENEKLSKVMQENGAQKTATVKDSLKEGSDGYTE